MKKNFIQRALIIMSSIFAVGIICLLSASKIGENAGNKALTKNGGAMDTSTYERIVDTTTHSYQLAGGVLSLLGGCGLLISGYAVYKEIE